MRFWSALTSLRSQLRQYRAGSWGRRPAAARRGPRAAIARSAGAVAERLEERMLLAVSATFEGMPAWVEEGPHTTTGGQVQGITNQPVAGAVNSIAISPADNKTVFIATANGGVWRTSDINAAAVDWAPMTDLLPSLSVTSVAFGGTSGSELYFGVGRTSNGGQDGGELTGLYKTADATAAQPTWKRLGASDLNGADIRTVKPTDTTTASGRVLLVGTMQGLYRNAGGGNDFAKVTVAAGQPDLPVMDIQQHPTFTDDYFATVPGAGIFRSQDGGATWAPANGNGAGALPASQVTGPVSNIEISFNTSNDVLYAAFVTKTGSNHRLSGVFWSTTEGSSWTPLNQAGPTPLPNIHTGAQGLINLSIVADPANPNLVYLGGDVHPVSPFVGNLFVGDRGANTWNPIVKGGANTTAPHADTRTMVFLGSDILEGDDGGIYKLTNPDATPANPPRAWTSLNGDLGITELYNIAYDSVNDIIYGGAQDVGSPSQTSSVSTVWDESITNQADGGVAAIAFFDNTPDGVDNPTQVIRYTSCQELGCFRRRIVNTANGLVSDAFPSKTVVGTNGRRITDEDASQNKTFDTSLPFFPVTVANAIDSTRLMVASTFLYESTDRGQTFTSIGGLTDLRSTTGDTNDDDNDGSTTDNDEFVPAGAVGRVMTMAYGGRRNGTSNADVTYVGAFTRDAAGKAVPVLLLRTAAGGAFNPLAAYAGHVPKDLVVDPDDWHKVYVLDFKDKVWRSTDAGATWAEVKNLSTVFPDRGDARSIALYVTPGGDDVLLVGGQGGVFRTRNPEAGAGASWEEFGRNLPDVVVTDVQYSKRGDKLLAATFGRGAWVVSTASADLDRAAKVTIVGTEFNDTINLTRHELNPRLMDVTVTEGPGLDPGLFPISIARNVQIVVNGGNGNDTLIVDEERGVLEENGVTITFDGGEGDDDFDRINNPSFIKRVLRGIGRGIADAAEWIGQLVNIGEDSQDVPFVKQNPAKALNGGQQEVKKNGLPPGEFRVKDKTGIALVEEIQDSGFVNVLQAHLVQRVQTFLNNNFAPDVEDLRKVLANVSGQVGGVRIGIDPESVAFELTGDLLRFDVALHAETTKQDVPLTLGAELEKLGLKFDASAQIDFTASLDFAFSFGLDLTEGLAFEESFFLSPTSLSLGGRAVVQDSLDVGLSLGLLKAAITGGSFDVQGALTATFSPPPGDTDGRLSISEMFGADIGDIVDFAATASVDATLPASASLSGLSASGVITINDPNLFDGTPPTVGTTGFDEGLSFRNITPAAILNILNQLGTTLEGVADRLDVPGGIPFVEKTVNQLVNVVEVANDFAERFFDVELTAGTSYAGTADVPSPFQLAEDAHFKVRKQDGQFVDVTVAAAATATNATIADLVADVNAALLAALPSTLDGKINATAAGNRIQIGLLNPAQADRLILRYAADDEGMEQLGFQPVVDSAVFKFDSIESLGALIADITGVPANLSYDNLGDADPETGQLLLHLAIARQVERDLDLSFEQGLGPLTLVGHANATFTAGVGLELDLGIDLSFPLFGANSTRGTADAPSNGRLSAAATFTLMVGAEAPVVVTVNPDATNNTIADLVADINAAITQAFTSAGNAGAASLVTVGSDGNVITISASENLAITALGGTAATELHLVDSGATPTKTLAERISIKEGSGISASITFDAPDIDLFAALGMVGIGIVDGNAFFGAELSLDLDNGAGAADEYITLKDIGTALPDLSIAAPAGSLDPTLIGSGVLPLTFGSIGLPPAQVSFELRLDTNNADQPVSVEFDATGFEDVIASLGNLSIESVIALIAGLADGPLQDIEILNKKLPLIDRSVNELLDIVQQLAGVASELAGSVKVEALQAASTALGGAIASLPAAQQPTATQIQADLDAAIATLQATPTADALSLVGPILDRLEALKDQLTDPLDVAALDGAFAGLADSLLGVALKRALAQFDDVLTEAFLETLDETQREAVLDVRHALDGAISALSTGADSAVAKAGSIVVALVTALEAAASGLPAAALAKVQPIIDALRLKTPSLERIERVIEDFLGLEEADGEGVTLTFADNKLTALIDWNIAEVTKQIDVSIATPDLGIIEFGAAAQVDVTIGANLDLDFGIDFSGGSPAFFILDSTAATAEISLAGSIDLAAEILGVDVHIGGGAGPNITLGSIANPGQPASIGLTLADETDDDMYTFAELPGAVEFTADGLLDANLGIFVGGDPEVDPPVASIKASVDISDLNSFAFEVENLNDLLAALLAEFDLGAIIEGFKQFLSLLEKGLKSDVLAKLPIIGDDLDEAAAFIGNLRTFADQLETQLETVGSDIADTIRTFIFNALGSSAGGATGLALGLLDPDFHDAGGDGVPDAEADLDDVEVNIPDDLIAADEASIRFRLKGVQEAHPKFDLGLKGFGLGVSTEGQVDLSIGFTADVGIGLDKTGGFFFLDNGGPDPEVNFEVAATLAEGSQLKLSLFFLNLTATAVDEDDNGNETLDDGEDLNGNGVLDAPTGFEGSFGINLVPSDGDKVRIGDVLSTTVPAFEASFGVNLDLKADIADNTNLPTLSTNLVVAWEFSTASPDDTSGLQADLYNITLDFGDFFKNNLAPFFQKVNQFVEPLRPILAVLDTEIPVISQLSQLVGGPQVTFGTAIQFLGSGFESVERVRQILELLDDVAGVIDSLSAGSVNFGDFDLTTLTLTGEPPAGKIDDATLGLGFLDEFALPAGDAGAKIEELQETDEDGLGLIFPLFDNPAQIVNLLFGKPVDIIQWDIPRLEASFEFSQLFGPIIPPIPLFARISGKLGVFADLFVGFDTRGFQTGNFLNGFYFGDLSEGTTGTEVPELGLFAEFSAGAELNVVVASAGVRGGIRADITADWNDPNDDGKYYLDEILANLANGIECVMDLGGAFTAFFEAFVKIGIDTPFGFVTIFSETFNLGRFTIFDFSYSCPPLPPPVLAHVDGAGQLILHVGPNAGLRQPGHSTDDAETLNVRKLGPNKFEVKGFGETQVYEGVNSIFGDGGAKEDVLLLDPSVDVPATLLGGPGDDQLTGGSASDSLEGDAGSIAGDPGNDQLIGGAGNDSLGGGGGNDLMVGGAGGDNLRGDEGDDQAYGGDQAKSVDDLADTIDGGAGNDNIVGALGDDSILGGGGNDRISGDAGNDTINGGADADLIEGGAGADLIHGGAGNDVIYGEGDKPEDVPAGQGGNDTINGNEDNDTITDDEGDDVVDAGSGDDAVRTGKGNDSVLGGTGADSIVAGAGNDTVAAGAGADVVLGDEGTIAGTSVALGSVPAGSHDDVIAGDDDADILYGQAGQDSVTGGGGYDRIFGGDNDADTSTGALRGDTLRGGPGNDTILGEAGNDLAYGDADLDSIEGGSGADSLYGGLGNDLIRGQDGEDSIEGSAGDDTVFGGQGVDRILGGASAALPSPGLEGGLDGADSIIGDDSSDIILADNGSISSTTREATTDAEGGAGGDVVFGSTGDDIIFGQGLGDSLTGDADGGSGNDLVVGDQGSVTVTSIVATTSTVTGSSGDDTMTGSGGLDTMLGGDGDDLIAGDADADVLVGDNGRVTLAPGTGAVVRIETIDPSSGGDDTITGSGGGDVVLGGAGSDDLSGGVEDAASDTLLGDNGQVVFSDATDANDIFTTDPTFGGKDTITGGAGDDVILGGSGGEDSTTAVPRGGDSLLGDAGDDVVIGDGGRITRTDSGPVLVDLIETVDPGHGGDDHLDGGAGNDTMLGGFGADTLLGVSGADVLLGDNGLLDYTVSGGASTLNLITTTFPNLGDSDSIVADAGADPVGNVLDDTVMGGTNDEFIDAGPGRDLVFGDHGMVDLTLPQERNFFSIDTQDSLGGGDDTIAGNAGDDTAIGGQGSDRITGDAGDDDLIGGHNVAGGDDDGDALDGGAGNDLLAGDNAQVIRRGDAFSPLVRALAGTTIYNADGSAAVTEDPQANPTGAIGRDVILFDHSDATGDSRYGNDTMAGGAADDTLFGQLGDDTMRGDGSVDTSGPNPVALPSADESTDGDDYLEGNGGDDLMFGDLGQDDLIGGSSSLFGLADPAQRPDGADTVFGGDGSDVARNTAGNLADGGHAFDADLIVGDNADVYRLVGTGGVATSSFLLFTYDDYPGGERIIPRAVTPLDYTPGTGSADDLGGDDLLHGEAGDDSVHGMIGNDVLFGEGQDDDLFGGAGADWISGGTGEDGILGDDGKVLTSRNGLTEALYGLTTPVLQQTIQSNDGSHVSIANPTGELKKSVDLEPFDAGGDDTIYGGLGDDSLHGGAGTDALSGAEALGDYYADPALTPPVVFDPTTGKFVGFDDDPPMDSLRKIVGHALNFDASELDGNDALFGDLGDDWLVGGRGSDHLYGGLGNDILNAEDNLETNGGLNDVPDVGDTAEADTAFGGGGRDTLMANAGNDRLDDWVGEFNTYIVPFAPFGNATVVRMLMPGLAQFLYLLGASDGSDQTRVGDGLGAANRFGEPFGELGLVLQHDADWHAQTGAPTDGQAGNKPGGKK